MTLLFEGWVVQGLLNMFGGSTILLALFALGLFFAIMFFMRIPFPVLLPMMFGFSIVVGALMEQLILFAGLASGILLGYFLFRMVVR